MQKEVEKYLRLKRKLIVLEYARVFGSMKRKTPEINAFRGSLVDKRFETSNLDLLEVAG